MAADLVLATEAELDDHLGLILMECQMGSSKLGQFFTPFNLSKLCAKMTVDEKMIDEYGILKLQEPSCGGGGMVIATAKTLLDKGINYQRALDVLCQDLDWRCVYMCYIMLSLMGIKATVYQGDTLCDPYIKGNADRYRTFTTPAKKGMIFF